MNRHLSIRTFVTVASVICLFSTGFKIKAEPFDFYVYYAFAPILIFIGVASGANLFNRYLSVIVALLAVHSGLSIVFFGNPASAPLPQILGILAVATLYLIVFEVNDGNPEAVFRAYMKVSAAACYMAVLQAISFQIGFRAGYDFSPWIPDFNLHVNEFGAMRAQSVFSEPSHFAGAISAAIFVSIHNLTSRSTVFVSRITSAAIILSAVVSFSTMAYAAIAASLALLALNDGLVRRWSLIAACSVAATVAYVSVPEVQARADDTLSLLFFDDTLDKNLSTLSLYNNGYVALQNMYDSYLLGGGLGSHPVAFEKHSLLYSATSLPIWLTVLNAQDANSLFLRVMSELGIFGVAGLVAFLFKLYVSRRRSAVEVECGRATEARFWLISNAALVFFVVALIRSGHYFGFGVPFFALVYVFAWRSNRLHRSSSDSARLDDRAPPADEGSSPAPPQPVR